MGRLILLLVTGCIAGFVYAVQHLPWWGVALMIAGVILAVPLFLKFALKRLILMPFRAKGAVLRGAEARVHSVQPAEAPPPESSEGEEAGERESDEPRDWFLIELTIVPKASTGAFKYWEPGDIGLVRPEFRPLDVEARKEDVCRVERVEVEEDGQFQPDEGLKYNGSRRIRLLAGIRSGVQHLKFRYYLETFGDVRLGVRVTTTPT